ncbi:MAG TPA: inorganic diphosphatase [Polyangiales bacterium]
MSEPRSAAEDRFPSSLEVVIDIPRLGFIKRDDDGHVDFISPLPCPFNYGSVPNTLSGDGDREDALVLGERLARGRRVQVPVVARVDFEDAGLPDPKWVCSFGPLSNSDRRLVDAFFTFYAHSKSVLNHVRGKSGVTRYRGLRLR